MTLDFTYLKESSLEQATAWMDLPRLRNRPRLHLAPLTFDNREWFEHMLALRKGADPGASADASYDGLTKIAVEDAENIAKFCLKGWSGVIDAAGALVPYSPEAGVAFLTAIARGARWQIRDIVAWVKDPSNFVALGARVIDHEVVAKNS